MADLQVNDGVLAESERRLTRLHSEFSHLDDEKDDLGPIWGAPAVEKAMGGFFDNWSHYRKKLLTTIESVGTMVTDTRKVFRETDAKLAKSVAGHGRAHNGGKAGHQ
jgi:hypothetical protein